MQKALCCHINTNKILPQVIPLVQELDVECIKVDILRETGMYDDILSAFHRINVEVDGIVDITKSDFIGFAGWCASKGFRKLWIGNQMDDHHFAQHWQGKMKENFEGGIQACKDAGVISVVNVSWNFGLATVLPYMRLADEIAIDVYTCDHELLRARLRELGKEKKPLLVGESNMEMSEYTPEKQAQEVPRLMQTLYEEGVKTAYYYSLKDHSDWTGHYYWGVVNRNWEKKPVFDAIKNWRSQTPPWTIGFSSLKNLLKGGRS